MKSGYDQFFNQAKKFSLPHAEPVDLKKIPDDVARVQRKKKKRPQRPFPFLQFSTFGFCILAIFLLIEKFDDIESYLTKIEIGLPMATANAPATPVIPPEAIPPEANPPAKGVGGAAGVEKAQTVANSPIGSVPGEGKEDGTDYLFKLAERKKELDAREEELNRKTQEIAKQKTELEGKIKQLEQYREKISGVLKERIATDSKKVDSLVQLYTNMKATQAAKIFETMDEDLVIEILTRMKKKGAADILNLVKADKAQILSERFAGYRAPAGAKTAETEMSTTGNEDVNQQETQPEKGGK